jgi:signal transduction histidine kinase
MKIFKSRYIAVVAWLVCLVMLIASCSASNDGKVVALNEKTYEAHYKSLDSTKIYAEKALSLVTFESKEWAHAMNDMAFYYIAKMQYAEAERILDEVVENADDEIELMISRVQLMRLCQRKSQNKNFYHERHYALQHMKQIEKEYASLSATDRKRFVYARSEYWIVLSTYLYYIGQPRGASEAVLSIEEDALLMSDMPQLLTFYYNVGSGGILLGRQHDKILRTEFNYLIRCYMLARQCGYTYWEANSMQALSEKLQDESKREFLLKNYRPEINFLNVDYMPDTLLAGNLAERALDLFRKYGDVYQIAGAWRTLSEAFFKVGDNKSALICLNNAIANDTTINAAPDLVASIREQMSIVYSALDNKKLSDYNRNIYLDMQEYTRQDRMLEARAEQLDSSLRKQDIMIAIVIVAIILLIVAMAFFIYKTKKEAASFPIDSLLQPLNVWQKTRSDYYEQTEERYEEMREQIAILQNQYEHYLEKNIEQRAKVSLASSVAPLINRMLHEVKVLSSDKETDEQRNLRYEYIGQLASSIEQTNERLTDWVKLKQGEIVLRIESFELQALFDTLRSSDIEYKLHGIRLNISPTHSVVKADKVLTLFMLNTIAENARRFTPNGGSIDVYADETDDYVEVSVKDSGKGMDEAQLASLFKPRYITDSNDTTKEGGHGFGLLNCKGIIEKYKKMSSFFSVCSIEAESEVGKGSRVFFRLPKGMKKALMLCALFLGVLSSCTKPAPTGKVINESERTRQADSLVDSIYYYNVAGNYQRTLQLSDSCVRVLNRLFADSLLIGNGERGMLLKGTDADDAIELKWFRDSVSMDYSMLLALRNEVAVAALAVHDIDLYTYNNQVFTKLFRESSADRSIATYVQKMQRAENNRNVAIVLLVLLLLAVFPAYYFLYYRHKRFYNSCIERIGQINDLLQSDTLSSHVKMRQIRALWKNDIKIPKQIAVMGKNTTLISDIVERICGVLAEDVNKTASMEQQLVVLEEDTKRITVNRDRLYVINNILDNRLSTLKHETMFYPSRLKQILQARSGNAQMSEKELLATLDEIASYYETMYTTLLSQTVQVAQAMSSFEPSVAMRYVLVLLKRANGGKLPKHTEMDAANGYIKLVFNLDTQYPTESNPQSTYDYLVLCQIMRDMGEYYRARGCGVETKRTKEGISIIVIYIKQDIWKSLKL